MSPLEQALADYLQVRRSLGYKLTHHGELLPQFVAYLQDVGAERLTTEHALRWAMLSAGSSPAWCARRLVIVRGFARYLQSVDPGTEVPPTGLLVGGRERATPYLYSGREIAALIAAADTMRFPLRTATYQTLIGLLAVTGLRIGEAIALDRCDFEPEHGLLTVRHGKFGKSREIPLHSSTIEALDAYLHQRDRLLRREPAHPAMFISTVGTRLLYSTVNVTFHELVRRAGLTPRSARCRPRLHDLRHTFAVNTVMDGYQVDGDVQARLSLLSTYMGHVDPISGYWYLSAAPELLALAAERLERHPDGEEGQL
jgi:integrase